MPTGITLLENLSNFISFMVFLTSTNVIYWKENPAIFLNFVLVILTLGWVWNFRTRLPVISRLLAKLLTFPGHAKRFKEGTVSAK